MIRPSGTVRRYLVPAFVFQAVLSGGGYASGREMYQFVVRFGRDGFFAMGFIATGFFVMLFLSAELARKTRSYNYRKWAHHLLGHGWLAFDVLYVAMAVVAIAVVASAATNVISDELQVPYLAASAVLFVAIAVLTTLPRRLLEGYESVGTILLTSLYVIVAVLVVTRYPAQVIAGSRATGDKGWLLAAALYVGYNLVVVPSCLFTFDNFRTARESAIGSLIAAVVGTIPIGLAYMVLIPFRLTLATADVPLFDVLRSHFGAPLLVLYHIVLFATLVDTGVGLVHAILERVNDQLRDSGRSPLTRWFAVVSIVGLCLFAALMSQIGIIALVGKVYPVMGVAFIALYAVPLVIRTVVGVWPIPRSSEPRDN